MSHDPIIKLDLENNSWHRHVLTSLGVPLVSHDIRALMPPGFKEPEIKILVERPKCFQLIRALFFSSQNCHMVSGQEDWSKLPLCTTNVDTAKQMPGELAPGIPILRPTAQLMVQDVNLRLRFNIDPNARSLSNPLGMTNLDYNEKTLMAASETIHRITNRDERELEMEPGESLEMGYNRFHRKYRRAGSPAHSDGIPFQELVPYSGIVTARTTYAVLIKHPTQDCAILFEVCEDRYDTLMETLNKRHVGLYELEMEPKQVFGTLPNNAKTPEGFRNFVHDFMDGVGTYIVKNVKDCTTNERSKAEIAASYIDSYHGDCSFLTKLGTTPVFNKAGKCLLSHQYALMNSFPLERALQMANKDLSGRSERLHIERMRYTKDFLRPDDSNLGQGSQVLHFEAAHRQKRDATAAQPVFIAA